MSKTENRYVYRTLWEPLLNDQITCYDIDGLWDIPEHFSINLRKESPEFIEMEDLMTHFRKGVVELTKDDDSLDGRDYRKHPTAANNLDGSLFYYGQELNWWVSLLLQKDSSPDTVLRFARSEYQTRVDSIRGIIYKISSDMSSNGYTITLSQFRQLFLKEIANLNLGVIPSPFSESSNPLKNFIATPAHFGFVLAEEPGFVFDHITQRMAYFGILGETIPLPFGDTQPNLLDLFYHEVQKLIYDTVPDRFKAINATNIDWGAQYDNISTINMSPTYIIRPGVYRIPNNQLISPLDKVEIIVNGVSYIRNVDFQVLSTQRDIAFNRTLIPLETDSVQLIISGYIDETIVPNPYMVQKGKAVFDIRNYVYSDESDKTLIRCYTSDDVLAEEERQFINWLKHTTDWKTRALNPFINVEDIDDPFSWNYRDHTTSGIPAVWYEIYEQEFNTSGPQYEPWIVNGYVDKPEWWDIEYPPTSDGLYPYINMWSVIQNGQSFTNELAVPTDGFTPSVLNYTLPININTGELLPPYSTSLIDSMFTTIPSGNFDDFIFGDNSPTEMLWRNSVDYRWDYIMVGYNLKPIDFVSLCWDADRMRTWVNGVVFDTTLGKVSNHTNMVFFGDHEEVIENDIIVNTYDYIANGYTDTFSGESYDFTPIEVFDGNGLQIEFDLEYPSGTGYVSLVEVNGAIVTENVDYSFIDVTGDGALNRIIFVTAPGSFAATTGSEWDSRVNSIIPISDVDVSTNELLIDDNFDQQFPDGMVIAISDSTGNDGFWTIKRSYFDGTQTHLVVFSANAPATVLDIDPDTNTFTVEGDHELDYVATGRVHVTDSSLYTGRWVIEESIFDGTNTSIRLSGSYPLTLNSVDYFNNTIIVDADQTHIVLPDTEITIDTTSGRDTIWTVLTATYNQPLDETTIVLAFPTNSHPVVGVDQSQSEFIIGGYQLFVYPFTWNTITITDSTGNDGVYTITNTYYNNDGNTVIRVVESIPNQASIGTIVISGTMNSSNLIIDANSVSTLPTNIIFGFNSPNNTVTIIGDYSTSYVAGISLTIRNSDYNNGDWEILSSVFDGTYTIISIVPPRNVVQIISVNTINDTFTVDGDLTIIDQIGQSVSVENSTGNDNVYVISNAVYTGTQTIFTVTGDITSPVANGTMSLLSEIDPTASGYVIIIDGIIDSQLEPTANGVISNEQFWNFDIVGWDDISLGVSVPVRIRVGTPSEYLSFDEDDEVDVYIDDSSYANALITTNIDDVEVLLDTQPNPFEIVTVSVYNPRDIIESQDTIQRQKLTIGLNQWYSQFYRFRGKRIATTDSYSGYWRNWQSNIVYRTKNIINPESIIVQALGNLVFRNNFDYHVELDVTSSVSDFYIDSFLVTVSSKTETSFDTNGIAPESTLFEINNYDPRRNFVKTAVARKDVVFRFNLLPLDSDILEGDDSSGNLLAFRSSDILSCIIDSVFYDIIVDLEDQTITLTQDAIDAIDALGSEVAILVEPLTQTRVSHSTTDLRYVTTELVSTLSTNEFRKDTLLPTDYQVPLEFEVDALGELKTQEIILPMIFTAQELIVFMAEYERYLLEAGGVFDELDDSSYRNYVSLIGKFMMFVDDLEKYDETTFEQRYIEMNVMQSIIKIGTEFGQLGKIESEADIYSKQTQDLLDTNGVVISNSSFQVIREDGLAIIKLIGDNQVKTFTADSIPFTPDYIDSSDPREGVPIFPTDGQIWFKTTSNEFYIYNEVAVDFQLTNGEIVYLAVDEPLSIYTGHFIVDKFESVIRFENDTSTSRSIYTPLTGVIIRRLYLQFEKARVYTGRPVFSGFALTTDPVSGLLKPIRNIESQIDGMLKLYDPFNVPLDNNFDGAIPDLLGFEPKDYLKRFLGGSSPRALIGFQQGFIQQKGASDNVSALVEAIKSIVHLNLFEVWAYKLAEYGDISGEDYVILRILEKEGARTILGLHFTDANNDELPDPGLVEVKENDPDRFPQLLDQHTTKDGYRFYFPAVKEGSVVPEWEINVIGTTTNQINTYSSPIINTNEFGFDFGTYGSLGIDRNVRIAAATLYQDPINYTNAVDVLYFNEQQQVWTILAKNIPTIKKSDYYEVRFPVHSVRARLWKLEATDLNAGTWQTSLELHLFRAVPDYSRIGKISAFNNRTNINVTTWFPWDVLEGFNTPEAYQYVDHDIESDPAIYSTSAGDQGHVEQARAWGVEHVGEVWWNKDDWGVIDYKNVREFPTTIQRSSLWGKLSSGKKVSIYEWTKSPVPPEEWADLVKYYDDIESVPGERLPAGVVKSLTDYTREVRTDPNNHTEVFYYFWTEGSTVRSYTRNGDLRSLSLQQIASGLEHPDNIPTNKFYIIDDHLYESDNWIVGGAPLPDRFTKWFGNRANEVFLSDYIDLHLNRSFILSNNLESQDFRGNRHEEWQLLHTGQNTKPPTQLWDEIVHTLTTPTCALAADYDSDNPNRCFMPRDELIRLLNRRVIDIRPSFFQSGYESVNVSGVSTFEKDTPFDGASSVVTFDLDSNDPYKDIRSLGDTNVAYFSGDDIDYLNVLMSRQSPTSFYNIGTPSQVNELFFDILEESIAFDTKKPTIFKTSWIAYDAVRLLIQTPTWDGTLKDLGLILDFIETEAKPYHTHINDDISRVTLTYPEIMYVNVADDYSKVTTLLLNDLMDVSFTDLASVHTNMYVGELIDLNILDAIPTFVDINVHHDEFDAVFFDTIDVFNTHLTHDVVTQVAFSDSLLHSIAIIDHPLFDVDMNVEIIDYFHAHEYMLVNDNLDAEFESSDYHIHYHIQPDYLPVLFDDDTHISLHDWSYSNAEFADINIIDSFTPRIFDRIVGVGDDYMDASVDEFLRIDISEYDVAKNWWYSWYMLHDGGQNLDYIEGDSFGNPPDGIFVGLEPGLDEDPSSEDWYRWDGLKLDDQYYISSFDNFETYDTDLEGYDLDVIGRVGYNWDGVGKDTINSLTPSGKFLRARPSSVGLPPGNYAFWYEQFGTPSDTWIVTHNLQYIPIIRIFLVDGTEIIPSSITTTINTATITFTSPVNGTARFI